MMEKPIPIIKEDRIDKIMACLNCIADHPFDRIKQRNCIMELYPGKTEKVVFRGMAIPSLRHLGFIIGRAGGLRVSANARIIVNSEGIGYELHRRSLRAVIYEVDKIKFGFIDILSEKEPIILSEFIEKFMSFLNMPYDRVKERVVRWLSILNQAGLINRATTQVSLSHQNHKQAVNDLDISNIDAKQFQSLLFDEYFKLGKKTAGIVDITDLRASVASMMLIMEQNIVTEGMFDNLLRSMPFATENYLISLGRPMGAEEKLFGYKGNYYRTISIEYLKGG